MSRLSKHFFKGPLLRGPSRREFIAGGTTLLIGAAGMGVGSAAEISDQKYDLRGEQQRAASGNRNALYSGPITSANSARKWRALWITSPHAPRKAECVLHFRKEMEVGTKPSRFLIYATADNQYLLKVNGEYVGTGPSHSDVRHWKYTTYDIASLLRPGKNLIAATVWNFGEHAPMRQISDRLGFLLDGDAANSVEIHTDRSWIVVKEEGLSTPALSSLGELGYYAASAPEKLDASSFRWGWDDPNMNASGEDGWHAAVPTGAAVSRGMTLEQPDWQLAPDGLPLMERREISPGKIARISGLATAGDFPASAVTIPANQRATILIDAGHLTTAYPELRFSKGRGAEIKMTYAEALYNAEGRKGNRNDIKNKHISGICDFVYPDGSEQRKFSPLDWRAWRYLQLDVKTENVPLELHDLKVWFTAYPFVKKAEFNAGNAELASIMEVGYRTARVCAHDTYMDTPYWERLQYIGDTRIEALISYVMTGDNRLAREAIRALHNSTIAEGITLSRYPSSQFQSIPGFSLFWIGMVHDFWRYNDDPQFVREQLPLVRSTLSWFAEKQNENGLLGRLPWWPFVDWSNGFIRGVPPQEATGDSAILSLQFVEALRYAAEMERALGLEDMAQRDMEQADFISNAVRRLCWSGEYELLADTPAKNHYSQHTNAFGVWLDVVPVREQKNVMNRILSVNNPGFAAGQVPPDMSLASYYFRFYLARAMAHAGIGDRYLETLGPWKQMLAEGLTTWAEMPPPTRSDSHAWSAHPNYDLLTTVAGISPDAPNFASVRIEPSPGKLKHLDATMPTPKGLVRVQLDMQVAKPHAAITMPPGLDGWFVWKGRKYRLHAGWQEFDL